MSRTHRFRWTHDVWIAAAAVVLAAGLLPATSVPGEPLRQDPPSGTKAPPPNDIEWHRLGPDGKVEVILYYFWSRNCGHCEEAKPHVDALVAARPWLKLVPYEVSNLGNVVRYLQMSEALGQKMGGVPAFFLCGKMAIGRDGPEVYTPQFQEIPGGGNCPQIEQPERFIELVDGFLRRN